MEQQKEFGRAEALNSTKLVFDQALAAGIVKDTASAFFLHQTWLLVQEAFAKADQFDLLQKAQAADFRPSENGAKKEEAQPPAAAAPATEEVK